MRMQTIAKVDSSQTSNQRETAVYLCICIYVADVSWRCVSFRIFSVDFSWSWSSYVHVQNFQIYVDIYQLTRARYAYTNMHMYVYTCAIITIDIIITVPVRRVLINDMIMTYQSRSVSYERIRARHVRAYKYIFRYACMYLCTRDTYTYTFIKLSFDTSTYKKYICMHVRVPIYNSNIYSDRS